MRRIIRISLASIVITLNSFMLMANASNAPWWQPLICAPIEAETPGSSRENARKVELADLFEELDALANTYENFDYADELPPPIPTETLVPNCQWVEFEGYFRPVRYHQYKGQMLPDIEHHYLAGGTIGLRAPHFWVASWVDPETISHFLHNHRIRIRGQVHDQCLAIMQYDRVERELGLRFGGACHYGENTGMILTQAEVVEVISEEKQIARQTDLSDVLGTPVDPEVASSLFPPDTNRSDLDTLIKIDNLPAPAIQIVKDWVKNVQSGPEALIEKEETELGKPIGDYRIESIRRLYAHPDGRNGFLNAQSGFSAIDPDTVDIQFLGTRPFGETIEAPRNWMGYGCVALEDQIAWPAIMIDAALAIDDFACIRILYKAQDKSWQ